MQTMLGYVVLNKEIGLLQSVYQNKGKKCNDVELVKYVNQHFYVIIIIHRKMIWTWSNCIQVGVQTRQYQHREDSFLCITHLRRISCEIDSFALPSHYTVCFSIIFVNAIEFSDLTEIRLASWIDTSSQNIWVWR